jgi:agmatinase
MSDFGGALKKSSKFDVALIGVPYDGKSCYLKGAAEGPEAIRTASTSKAINPWTELRVNLEKDLDLVDLGDVDTSGDFQEVFSRIEEKVSSALDKEAVPFVLGGDHSISYPVVKAFSKKFDTLDILHFDAHPDLYEELYGDRFSHACPFARIMEEGLAQNLVQVGIRAATGEQREKARRYAVQMIEMKDVPAGVILDFKNPVYISFDLDALDPAFAPGVSHHEAGGLSTRQAVEIIHRIEAPIAGLDVVELNPRRDPTGITAAAAVKIIMETAGQVAGRQKKKKEEAS